MAVEANISKWTHVHILHFLFGNVAKWFGPVQHDEYTGDKWC